jgi:Tfp pilus assembly protein PilX
MKGFWLVMMLLGLLVTAWLVMRDMNEHVAGSGAPAAVKTMERAEQAVKAVDAAQKEAERRINGAGRE